MRCAWLMHRARQVVACGPFSVRDDLAYEPLEELLDYAKDTNPDVLLLVRANGLAFLLFECLRRHESYQSMRRLGS